MQVLSPSDFDFFFNNKSTEITNTVFLDHITTGNSYHWGIFTPNLKNFIYTVYSFNYHNFVRDVERK